jgi:copper chaperone CopZ
MTKLPASVAVIVGVLTSSAAFAAEKTITLAVQHMTCAACPGTVKKSLLDVSGVTNVAVSAEDKSRRREAAMGLNTFTIDPSFNPPMTARPCRRNK